MRQEFDTELQALVRKLQERDSLMHTLLVGVADGAGRQSLCAAGQATPDSTFFFASATKLATAALVMQLVEQNRVDLSSPLSTWLAPEWLECLHVVGGQDVTERIDVAHLLGHTSGLADYFEQTPRGGRSVLQRIRAGEDPAWTARDALRWVREDLAPVAAPGVRDAQGRLQGWRARAHYSDTNYQLLGLLLEAVHERPLAEVFRERLLDPLGLAHTWMFGDEPVPEGAGSPLPIHDGPDALAIDAAMGSFRADGGLAGTLADALVLVRTVVTGALFQSQETARTMQQFNRMFFPFRYGLGVMQIRLPRILSPFSPAPCFLGHAGASGSFLFLNPELDLAIAGTVNQLRRRASGVQILHRVHALARRHGLG